MMIRSLGPKTAIGLVAVSNLIFAIHYGAWRYGFIKRDATAGIDPFAGAVALWLLLFVVLTMVEVLLIFRGLRRREHRLIHATAAGKWLLQFWTIRFLYVMLEGV